MARSLVLGNGNVLVCLDRFGQVRDFYFPYVGLENHIARGDMHRIGVYVDNVMSWLDDGSWDISVSYEPETLVSHITASSASRQVTLAFEDVVYNEKNILVRHVAVTNGASSPRQIKVFFNQQFQLSRNTHADTVYYNPYVDSLVHYKGRRVFLIGGESEGQPFTEYTTGLFKTEGKDGTWRDAEDGRLEKNPIEHGSVDSTIAFSLDLNPGEGKHVDYWVVAAETYREVCALKDYIKSKTVHHLMQTTRDFWRAWVNKYNFTFYKLSEEIIHQFKLSLLIIRTHCDNRGGILASGDSDNFQYGRDTYGYIWPRDGAFVAMSLDATGYFDIANRFYRFCNEVITESGYILHKYQPDHSLGSSWHPWIKNGDIQLAIQEDETALIISGLWYHYRKSRNLEFIESVYNSFVQRAANFLVSYIDPKTNLPKPSYDLWEERRAVSTFTSATVYGALVAAGQFAKELGKSEDEAKFQSAANLIHQGIIKHLYNSKRKYFYKSISTDTDGSVVYDDTIDTGAFFGIFRFGVLPPTDEIMIASHQTLEETIGRQAPIQGLARYEGDAYYQVDKDAPSNPWFVTTLWNIQYEISIAKTEAEVARTMEKLSWVTQHATASGMLSEQLNPFTGEQVGVSPLTWSHAEYILTIIRYLEKLEELGICTVCYPVQ